MASVSFFISHPLYRLYGKLYTTTLVTASSCWDIISHFRDLRWDGMDPKLRCMHQSSDVLTFEVLNNPRRSHQPHSHFELCSLIKKNFIHNHSYIKIFGWEYVSYHVASNDFSLGSEYLELCSLTKKLICNYSYTKYFQKISLIIKSIYKDMLKTICAILISRTVNSVQVLYMYLAAGNWPPLCFGIWCILYLRMDGT